MFDLVNDDADCRQNLLAALDRLDASLSRLRKVMTLAGSFDLSSTNPVALSLLALNADCLRALTLKGGHYLDIVHATESLQSAAAAIVGPHSKARH